MLNSATVRWFYKEYAGGVLIIVLTKIVMVLVLPEASGAGCHLHERLARTISYASSLRLECALHFWELFVGDRGDGLECFQDDPPCQN